jgi:hypothetical protein
VSKVRLWTRDRPLQLTAKQLRLSLVS